MNKQHIITTIFLLVITLTLTSCATQVENEDELIANIIEQESTSEVIQPATPEAKQPAKEHKVPQELLPFNYQLVSGAKIPEKVDFTTKDGVKIFGSYFKPETTPAPTVIMLHMLGRTRGDYSKLAKAFQKDGFAVLTIDLRGHGASVFFGGVRRKYTEFTDEDWKGLLLDVKAATEYLEKREEMSSLAIIGASIGANAGLIHAVTNKDVDALILLSPGVTYRGLETLEAINFYGERPALIIATEDDQFAASSAKELANNAKGPHKLVIYPGEKHGTDMLLEHNNLDDEIYTWLKYFLGE